MINKKLNPKWLYASFVYDEAGNKIGTVRHIEKDDDTIVVGITGFLKPKIMSASELDKKGLICKPNAINKKYMG